MSNRDNLRHIICQRHTVNLEICARHPSFSESLHNIKVYQTGISLLWIYNPLQSPLLSRVSRCPTLVKLPLTARSLKFERREPAQSRSATGEAIMDGHRFTAIKDYHHNHSNNIFDDDTNDCTHPEEFEPEVSQYLIKLYHDPNDEGYLPPTTITTVGGKPLPLEQQEINRTEVTLQTPWDNKVANLAKVPSNPAPIEVMDKAPVD
ncbi:hypothetical protein WICPIJ_005952 [Wickerhamomyces pijperi]|uniref:Uncharacterized protein n=1 Tax=Wickerhamomyces pijperi TaxID=599730 RepID=A0A9P8Q573_WICPI|nr:hypothetical protein WICPIJ_005952 [Wickerhamomyces pijperi]